MSPNSRGSNGDNDDKLVQTRYMTRVRESVRLGFDSKWLLFILFFYNLKSLICHKPFTAPLNKMFHSYWQFEFLPLFTVCL